MSARKILILTGDFVEDYEVMVPFQILEMVGHTAFVACPGRKAGDKIKTAVHDFEGDQTFTEKRGHDFILNMDFDSINVSDFDALLIPGGRAPEYIRVNKKVVDTVKDFMKENKPIAAICHGPQVLIAADALKGRKCSACPYIEADINAAGGEYVDLPADKAIVDGNLITAPGWTAIPNWILEFLKSLGTEIKL